MKSNEKEIIRLKDKSIEAFLLSIEIFNKPTITYRLEGCVFFLCNAWELLLKAKLLSDGIKITYPNKEHRSLSLKDTIKKVITNEKDPIRINMDQIIFLRNSSTHFIIPEFEIEYLPLITFSVKKYCKLLKDFFDESIDDYIKTDFLALFTNRSNTSVDILKKYNSTIDNVFKYNMKKISALYEKNPNLEFSQSVTVNLKRVSKPSLADYTFYSSKNPKDPNVKPMYVDKDINSFYPNKTMDIVDKVDNIITANNIIYYPLKPFEPLHKGKQKIFNQYAFQLIINKYKIKGNSDFHFELKDQNQPTHRYSEGLVGFIISKIQDNPNITKELHEEKYRKRN